MLLISNLSERRSNLSLSGQKSRRGRELKAAKDSTPNWNHRHISDLLIDWCAVQASCLEGINNHMNIQIQMGRLYMHWDSGTYFAQHFAKSDIEKKKKKERKENNHFLALTNNMLIQCNSLLIRIKCWEFAKIEDI